MNEKNTENNYIKRLIIEIEELTKKTELLNDFLKSDKLKEIEKTEQSLLNEQYSTMIKYLNILKQRINLKTISFESNLPETSDWKDTQFSEELENAIKNGYSIISTPDDCLYFIINKNSVQNINIKMNLG